MSKVPITRKAFKLQIMDLLLQINIPAGIADEIASEVVKKSEKNTPIETIRAMILETLRNYDAPATAKLTKRFEYVTQLLENVKRDEVGPAGEIYDEKALDELLKADEITAAELYFMEGREGRSWRRKRTHYDSISTELASEDRYED